MPFRRALRSIALATALWAVPLLAQTPPAPGTPASPAPGATAPPPTPAPAADQPWDRSGTAAGSFVNGLQNIFRRSALVDDNGRVGFVAIARRYNETYGPAFAGANFNMMELFGPKTNRKVLFVLIKGGMVLALTSVFITFAFKAARGTASAEQIGWSLGKTVISALFVSFPGIVYAFALFLPIMICQLFGLAAGNINGRLSPSGPLYQDLQRSMRMSLTAAEAYVDGAMASQKAGLNDETNLLIYGLAQQLNKVRDELAKNSLTEAPAIPLPALTEANGVKKVQANADTMARIQIQFRSLFHVCISKWENWPNSTEKQLIINAHAAARARLEDRPEDQEHIVTTLNGLRTDVYGAARQFLRSYFLQPAVRAVSRTDSEGDQRLMVLYAGGDNNAKVFVDALKEKVESEGFAEKTLNAISTALMRFCLPAIAALWMFALELQMVELMLFTSLWIHPSQEQKFTNAFARMFSVAMWMPAYLLCFIVLQKVLAAVVPAEVFSTSTGIIGNMFNLLISPFRVLIAFLHTITAPITAGVFAYFVMKQVKNGGSLIGGVVKGAVTSVGTTAAMAVPALRLGALAAASHAASQAQGAETKADGSQGVSRVAHRARAAVLRRGSSALLAGQDTLGKAFGANDKYIETSQHGTTEGRAANRAGALAATQAAITGTLKATLTGGNTSAVITHVEKQGEVFRKARDAGKQQGSPEDDARSMVQAQRESAAATKAAADALLGAVQQINTSSVDRRVVAPQPVDLESSGSAPTDPPPPPPPPAPRYSDFLYTT